MAGKSKVVATDIHDIIGEDEVTTVQEPTEVEDVIEEDDDFFDDFGEFGNEAVAKAADLSKIEGTFFGKSDWANGSIIVSPVQYRNLPESMSREVLMELYKTDPALARQIKNHLKVNVFGTLTIQEGTFDEKEIAAFNKPIPDGEAKLYKSPTWETWGKQDDSDPIHWLGGNDKGASWYESNLENQNRAPINSFDNTKGRIKRMEKITIPVIDQYGALRFVQTSSAVAGKVSDKIKVKSFSGGAMEDDHATEWFGRTVLLSKDGGTYTFQILETDDRLTDEQRERISEGKTASEHGVQSTNRTLFGENKTAPSRQMVLDFFGVRHLWENR